MRAFRFTLQAVHTLRERQEQSALEQHALALRDHQAALVRLQRAETELAAAWSQLQAQLQQGCEAAQARRLRTLCTAVEERFTQAQATLDAAATRVRQTLDAMLDARRQREAVDSLRTRQKRQYDRDFARLEHKLLDEMGSRRPSRNAEPRHA